MTKKRVIIVHGWKGHPKEGWFPWLKKQLEQKNYEVRVPKMPQPRTPKIGAWIKKLRQETGEPDKNTFLVGHSMGCQAILRYLQTLPEGKEIGGAVFVAGFVSLDRSQLLREGNKVLEIAKPWLETPLHWDDIRTHCPEFIAIFSDDDPYVFLQDADTFKEKLGAKIIIEHGKKHFSGKDGINELPVVLEQLTHLAEHH